MRTLYHSRQNIFDLLNNNAKIRSEAIYKSKQNKTEGTSLKMLTPKQMLQRLSIALAQVKAGDNSETITINLKYPHPHGMMNFNYQMDLILYQIFKIISNTF